MLSSLMVSVEWNQFIFTWVTQIQSVARVFYTHKSGLKWAPSTEAIEI